MKKFYKKVLSLSGRASADYKMIEPGDRLLAGLSGGVDSLLLLHVLHDLRRRAPFDFEIIAVTFDPGFEGFNATPLAAYAGEHNWRHETVCRNVEAILCELDATRRPCAMCSRIRRGRLQEAMAKHNCNKLVLGQHLDDIAASFLISFFRGQGVTTMGPNVPGNSGRCRIIRPLCYVTKEQILAAAENFDFPECGKCVFDKYLKETGDRAWAEELINRIEADRIGGVRQAMLTSLQNVETEFLLDRSLLQLPSKSDSSAMK